MSEVTPPSSRPVVRAWTTADRDPVERLLPGGSPGGHTRRDLHGTALDGGAWRRSLVAELDGHLVGVATGTSNGVHPARYPATVEVAPSARRQGVGSGLLGSLLALRPVDRPLAVQVSPLDDAAQRFVRRHGGRRYQHCPGVRPNPRSPEVRRWCRDNSRAPGSGVVIAPLSALAPPRRAEAWIAQYEWVHASWSPADPGRLRDLAPEVVSEADPDLSVVTVSRDSATSVTWAFAEGDGAFTVVCETARPDTPRGRETVAVALARCLDLMASRGVERVEIDGHQSDPHLGPVLRTLPPVPAEPLDLVELT